MEGHGESMDLATQREKIQQQILALEKYFDAEDHSDLSSCSSLDGEESDEDEDEDEEDDVTLDNKSGLDAKHEKIQREIKELEETLGLCTEDDLSEKLDSAGNVLSDEYSDDDDDDDLQLPQNAETCLEMNQVYQDVVKEKLAELEQLLQDNRKKQREIESQLDGSAAQNSNTSSALPTLRMYIGNFMKPYFKDKVTGLGPPANPETREIQSAGTTPCDEKKIKRWEGWQKSLLISAVVQDTMKRMVQPKMSKMEYLRDKMSKAEESDKEALQNQIKEVEVEIAKISDLSEGDLMGTRTDEHDWDKISNIDFEGKRDACDIKQFWQNYLHPSINKSSWSSEEIEKLKAIVDKYKSHDWEMIAEKLENNRTAFMCFQAHQRYIYTSFKKRAWTSVEDRKLTDLVHKKRIGNFIPYTQISYFMDGRDAAQCIYRWTSVLDPSIKKGPWSKEEDEMLLRAVQKHGVPNWWRIKFDVPGRTDGQVRDRSSCIPGKWVKIATEVPNRIDSQCLGKWRLLTKPSAPRKKRPPSTAVPRSSDTATPGSETRQTPTQKPAEKTRKKRGKRNKRKKMATADDEDEEMSEGEIEYLDSECEEEEHVASPSEPEVSVPKYVQPPLSEWIPRQAAGVIRLALIKQPNREDGNRSTTINGFLLPRVNYTALDRCGHIAKRFIAQQYQPPKQRTYEEDTILIPEYDVRSVYEILGIKSQQATEKDKRKTANQQRRSLKRGPNAQAAKTQLSNELMSVIARWMGNILIPLPYHMSQMFEVDVVRKRAVKVELSSTTVFLSLLKILHVDSAGCKTVISARSNKALAAASNIPAQQMSNRGLKKVKRQGHPSEPLKRICTNNSNNQQTHVLYRLLQPQPSQSHQSSSAPSSQPVGQVTQPRAVQPIRPSLVLPPPPLQSQTHKGLPPVAPIPLSRGVQVAQPLKMSVMPPPLSTSTTSVSTSTEQPTGPLKRVRKATPKAMELMEEAKAKTQKGNKRPRVENTNPSTVSPGTLVLAPSIAQTPLSTQDPNRLVANGIPMLPSGTTGLTLQNPLMSASNTDQTNGRGHIPRDFPTPVVFSMANPQGGPPIMMIPVLHRPNVVTTNTSGTASSTSVQGVAGRVPSTAMTTPSASVPGASTGAPIILLAAPSQVGAQGLRGSLTSTALTSTSTNIEGVTTSVSASTVTTPKTSTTAVSTSVLTAAVTTAHASTVTSVLNTAVATVSTRAATVATSVPSTALTATTRLSCVPAATTSITSGCAVLNPAGPYLTISPLVSSVALPHSLPTAGLPNLLPPPVGLIQTNSVSPLPVNGALPMTISPICAFIPPGNQSLTTLQDTSGFDKNVMFLEDPGAVSDWMSGRRGAVSPPSDQRLPYLPPFVGSVNTLQGLLKAKKSLLEHSLRVVPGRVATYIGQSEEEDVADVRRRVSETFRGNPAYLSLKTRFLACFTMPAFLATVNPSPEPPPSEDLQADDI
ncbi:snRNA-activating protein complex subunit 4 [Engraulis encrasicolus]|uniref:snRNA-activating protein complex subunit 4 n=1 Tax=Engraulis encrasicolus TaxID=184585 RepID=UPI002FD23DE7